MEHYDPSLIARLIPLNERTSQAWKDPHNAPFYKPASFQGFEHREGSSRDTTPFEDEIDAKDKVSDSESEIRLTLNDLPKDITEGFMFGKNKHFCDIYCGEWSKAFNISGRAFSITIDKKGQVVLKYLTPKSEISVQYGDQQPGVRTLSTWILFPDCEKGIVVEVADQLRFRVIVPYHNFFGGDYRQACLEYVTNVESAVASIPILTTNSQPVTMDPSRMPTPNTKPFYYRERVLGRGSSGTVYLVRDVSTGEEYAGKEFHCGQIDYDEGLVLASQKHLYIVGYVGVTLENGPLLLMKYVRGGNLAAAWRIKGEPWWHPMHIAQVLCQCLHALRYLHAKPTVVHRDIKPENILVEHRFPWPLIKICDFGLAKEGSKIDGKAGTWTYTAPEVLSEGLYNPSADIWSLGVVIMQTLLKGRLPKPKDGVAHGATWCSEIESFAAQNYIASEQKDRKSLRPSESSTETELWSFIMTCMLKVDAKKRFTALQCIQAGSWVWFTHSGRTDCGSSSGSTTSKNAGESSTAVARASGSDQAATEHDRPIHPIVAPSDVITPQKYKSAASGVTYDPGVDEAEVWKDQGSKGDATVKPAVDRANDGAATVKPAASDSYYWSALKRRFDEVHGQKNERGSSDMQHSTAATNARDQTSNTALANQYRDNFADGLTPLMRLLRQIPSGRGDYR